ncbi:hypothetical protein L2E82_26178 [Cichorium intybus]|uniref:Uncharacterized protein n=1 Tax=Cichorium intybus TaxID=13427 RepID=A0ACB9E542_CICIN|nr:hypothetical protein L2E82_26178 [Cichorium intybus]
MAGVDEAVVKFVNGEIKNSISTVIEPYAVDTDSKEKLIGSCNLDMVSSDSGTDCFSIPDSMNTKGGLIDNHIFENQTETVLGENQGMSIFWFTMTGQEQYFDFRGRMEKLSMLQAYQGVRFTRISNVSISLDYSFGTVLKEMKTLQKVWIWVCESEYGEDEGNCELAFLIFPINEHNRLKKHISAEGKVNNVVKDKNEVYQCFISQHQFGFDAVWLVDSGESELECEIPFMVLAFVKSNQFKNSPNKAKCHACEIVNTY